MEDQRKRPDQGGKVIIQTWDGGGQQVVDLDGEEMPGGVNARFAIRVAAGKEAAVLDARQAGAIRELLLWARQHRGQ